jgi:hypothetical protein
MEMEPWEAFVRGMALHTLIRTYEPWLWPLCETLHYLGLSLLLGTVGLFDLRVLGVAPGIPFQTIHRLIPWGIGAYVLNVLTGIVFFLGHPDQYFYNNAFRFKLLFMSIAGLNVVALPTEIDYTVSSVSSAFEADSHCCRLVLIAGLFGLLRATWTAGPISQAGSWSGFASSSDFLADAMEVHEPRAFGKGVGRSRASPSRGIAPFG